MNEFARPNLAVDQLPPANSADKDKVLTIDANGVPVWAENSGGGSGGGVLVVHIDEEYSALDKTWQEIHDALAQGTSCVTLYTEDDDNVVQGLIASVVTGGPPDLRVYTVHAITTQGDTVAGETWIATSRDGYPVYSA